MEAMIHNPIIRGFNPDPSICCHDGTYYVVNSTFEFFPGLPIWESKDLVNWSYVDSVLKDEEHLDLFASENNQGLYAPSIRFHEGRFYVVCTNKFTHQNFVTSAPSIHGPWTKPAFIVKDGIDPSLLFLDDGRCFYCSNGRDAQGRLGIFGQFINPLDGKLAGKMQLLTYGCGGHSIEGPHVYFIDGWYYLLVSEGGTGTGHHICMFRSKDIFGPYQEGAHNPALSHAERKGHEIQCTGHADLFKTEKGDWYAVFLATRTAQKNIGMPLGRESFLAPVSWKDGWPVFGNDGSVELAMEGGYGAFQKRNDLSVSFAESLEATPFLKVRAPHLDRYQLDREHRKLTLVGSCPIGRHLGHPTLLGLRQVEFETEYQAILDVEHLEEEAGIAVFHNSNYFYAISVTHEGAFLRVSLDRMIHGVLSRTESILLDSCQRLVLKITSDRSWYQFFVNDMPLSKATVYGMNTASSFDGGFTGTLFALWAAYGKATFLDGITYHAKEDDWVEPVLNPGSWI